MLAVVLSAAAGCARQTACPPAASAPLPKVAPAAAKGALDDYVELPYRASFEAYQAVERDLWARSLPRFFKGYQRRHFYDGPLVSQVASGFTFPPGAVLERAVTGERLMWSRRPHDGNSMVALLLSPSDELLSVALVGGDCALGGKDCPDGIGLVIYTPKGKASPDRIDPLRAWAKANGAYSQRPERVVQLP